MTIIFDIEKLRTNRMIAANHMKGHDFLFERAAKQLLDNLADINKEFEKIFIIGRRGSEFLQAELSDKISGIIYDIDDNNPEVPRIEQEAYDCIIALPYMHGVNDVPAFLMAVKHGLKPDGLFLNAFFGGLSLQELRQSIMAVEVEQKGGATQHIHPMIDHYQAASLIQRAEFALPVVDFDRVTVEYSDLNNLYLDLKNMGEGNALSDRDGNIHDMKGDIEKYYRDHYFNEGYVATFDIIHTIGWKAHESQQQPAKRGSGEVSLTEIL
jgi:SAM-dependent methyltransferase